MSTFAGLTRASIFRDISRSVRAARILSLTGAVRPVATLDPIVELNEADGIARKILTRQSVSEDEFRYAMMFSLTAMTRLLWELSNSQDSSKNRLGAAETDPNSQSGRRRLKSRSMSLVPLAALVAFLSGLGLGYLIP